jgi:hypothetical protein
MDTINAILTLLLCANILIITQSHKLELQKKDEFIKSLLRHIKSTRDFNEIIKNDKTNK